MSLLILKKKTGILICENLVHVKCEIECKSLIFLLVNKAKMFCNKKKQRADTEYLD